MGTKEIEYFLLKIEYWMHSVDFRKLQTASEAITTNFQSSIFNLHLFRKVSICDTE